MSRLLRYVKRLTRDVPVLVRQLGVRGAWDFAVVSPFNEVFFSASRRVYQINVTRRGVVANLRAGTSDRMVFDQIFAIMEYAPLLTLTEVSTVIDLGGNCGMSALWFLAHFPSSRVVVVEPDPNNLKALRANLAPFADRATIVPKAVWSSKTTVALLRDTSHERSEWGTRVSSDSNSESELVETCTVEELLDLFPNGTVDIIKMDIEGAEVELLSHDPSWTSRARVVTTELHAGEATALAFAAMPESDWSCVYSHEVHIFARRPTRRDGTELLSGAAAIS